MRRIHLFEWEDQPWLPRVFRDFITDQLRYTHSQTMRQPVNRAIAERLAAIIRRTGSERIVDLCSGAGGPLPQIGSMLAGDLGVPVRLVVTDLFPNVQAFKSLETQFPGLIEARYDAIDATDVPAELSGLRTLFTALHHFQPELVQRVLADAVRKNCPIAVFEPLERTARMVALVGTMSFVRGLTHAGIAGRLTPARALMTYVLPIAPAMFAWDGAVSTLRSYTGDELLSLARQVTIDQFDWEVGRFEITGPYGAMPTTYLTGIPRSVSR
jgi:hypothetical protein